MPKLIRITTVPISLKLLLTGQMRFMQENGFEVIMVSGHGKEWEVVKKQESCKHQLIPFTRAITLFQDLKCLWLLIRLFHKEQPDVVHTHTPKAGLLGMIAAKVTGVNVRLHTIAGLPLMTASGVKKKILTSTEKITYWSADTVLPNSHSIRKYIIENNLCPIDKLHIIGNGSSNGIDLSRFSRSVLRENKIIEAKRNINYHPSNKYLLTIGRMVHDKGIVELVNAFINVNKSFPNLKLILIGEMEEERAEETLPQKTKKKIINNKNIVHIQWSDEVEYYMAIADVLIHASHREGFPNVPLQAGAMECPIICSNIPGNIDIVEDNKTGIYFEKGNQKILEEKIIYALSNPEVMQHFAKILRLEIEEKYEREHFHQQLLKFYQNKLNIVPCEAVLLS